MAERTSRDREQIQSLIRGVAILRALGQGSASLDQVTSNCGFSRSATWRLLRTLVETGLVDFDGGLYRLTPGMLDLGYAQLSRMSLPDVVLPHCTELAAKSARNVSFAQLDGDEVVYVARAESRRLMNISLGVGTRMPAHLPSIGRVQLAWRSRTELTAYASSRMFVNNPAATVDTPERLFDELARIREDGWSYVADEVDAGLNAVAVPVWGKHGEVIGGLNIAGHAAGGRNATALNDLVPELRETADAIDWDLHARHLAG